MRPRFLVGPEAEAELDDAFAWYEGRVPGLGSEFMRAVRVAFSAIRRNPEQFPRCGTRSVGHWFDAFPTRSTT